jgi:hypothetical protein
MMDSARRPASSEPLVIRTGLPLRGPGSLSSEFFADGSRKDEFDDPDEEDSTPRRRRRTARGPMGRVPGEDAVTVGDHQPGYRIADRSASERAYRDMCRDLSDAWKSPEQRVADNARLTTDACPAGVDPRLWAYSEMVRDLQDAWMPRDAPLDPHEGVQAPRGIPPAGGISKHIGIQEGDSCTIDGRAGTWQDGGDGYLYCRPRPLGPPPRADAAPPRFMMVEDAQVIRDRAYREYVDHVSNAWKQP